VQSIHHKKISVPGCTLFIARLDFCNPSHPFFTAANHSLLFVFDKRNSLALLKKNASNEKNSQPLQAPCAAGARGVAGSGRVEVWRECRIRTFLGFVPIKQLPPKPGTSARNLI